MVFVPANIPELSDTTLESPPNTPEWSPALPESSRDTRESPDTTPDFGDRHPDYATAATECGRVGRQTKRDCSIRRIGRHARAFPIRRA